MAIYMPTCTCPQLNDRRLIRGVGRDEFKKNFDLCDIVRQVVREAVLIRARCGYFGVVRPTTRVLDVVFINTAGNVYGVFALIGARGAGSPNAVRDEPESVASVFGYN